MKSDRTQSETFDELVPRIRKERLRDVTGWSIKRVLVSIHDPLTRVLLRLPLSARHVTLLWFAVTLVSYAVTVIGLPWAFVAGALLLYLAIILDMCDGEIARYRARSMTPEEDLSTFISGMYLDRMFHLIASPLWPLAIAWGLDRMLDRPEVFAAGVVLMVFHVVRRGQPLLEAHLVEQFQPKVKELLAEGGLAHLSQQSAGKPSILLRVAGRIHRWIRNAKGFNFVVLIAGLADCLLWAAFGLDKCLVLYAVFLAAGAAALVSLISTLYTGTRVIAISDACLGNASATDDE